MKKKCLILLLIAMLLASPAALAKRPSRPSSSSSASTPSVKKEKLDIWNIDDDDLDYEDIKEIERLKEEAKQDRLKKIREQAVPKEKHFENNTVCSFGPQFREVSPRLTDEWYMFTPIDLSQDGTQTFDLIAGHMYVIGEVSVTVQDGRFEVDYTYNSRDIRAGREYFTIFKDYDSVTKEALERLPKGFTYDKSYSIEDKLGGDTDVILMVCNTATFKADARGIVRYFSTNPEREEMREALLDMIGK